MPAVRAFRPDADAAKWQCQIIRDHDHSLDRPLLFSKQTAHRLAAQVHVRLRLDELDRSIFNFRSTNVRAALFTLNLRLALFRQQIYEHKPEIVPRPFVLSARISQTDDEPVHIHAELFFRSAFAFSRFLADNCRFGTSLKLRFKLSFLHDRDHCDDSLRTLMDLDTRTNSKV